MLPLFTTQGDEAAPGAQALGKVELDLEGAPFLEPDPDEAPELDTGPIGTEAKAVAVEAQDAPRKNRKKLAVILGAILLGVILLGAALAYFLLFSGEKKAADPEAEVVVVPSGPPSLPTAPVDKFNIAWEPFWVEVADPEGEVRFVYCKIILVTDNQRIALQLEQKRTVIRDAVYYYLRHKPYSFLADLRQLDVLKSELLNIINYYILPETVIPPDLEPGEAPPANAPRERLREILIDEYLIK